MSRTLLSSKLNIMLQSVCIYTYFDIFLYILIKANNYVSNVNIRTCLGFIKNSAHGHETVMSTSPRVGSFLKDFFFPRSRARKNKFCFVVANYGKLRFKEKSRKYSMINRAFGH